MGRRTQGAAAVLAVAALACAGTPITGHAQPIPVDPNEPAVAQQWINPQIRPDDGQLGLTLSLVDAPATVPSGNPLSVTVRVRNDSESAVSGLTVAPLRGPASGSVADARAATVAATSEYTSAGDEVTVPELNSGEETEIKVTIPTEKQPFTSSFPMMLVLGQDGATLDTERWHMAVTGTPGTETEAAGATGETTAAGMSVLYPISAPVDIVPGETGEAPNRAPLILSSEQLAEQLAPGGRLDELVNVYDEANDDSGVRDATCLAVDPALLNTVERMAQGYTVDDDRPSPGLNRKRLRDSWGNEDSTANSEPGKGSEDATAWLTKLRGAAKDNCAVALPWANADLNAVARTGDKWLMREAIERGPFTVERVLQTPALRNVVVPGAGYLNPETAPGMGWADLSRSTLPESGMHTQWENDQAAQGKNAGAPGGRIEGEQHSNLDNPTMPSAANAAAPAPEQPVRVLVADNTVNTPEPAPEGETRFAGLTPGVTAVTFDNALASTLAATGPRPETPGYSDEYLRYDFTLDSVEARDLTAATVVRTAAQAAASAGPVPEGSPAPDPNLVNPPATWEASTAEAVMDTVAALYKERAAAPMALEDYVGLPGNVVQGDVDKLGIPESDPAVLTDTEVLNAAQQSRFINDLTALLANDNAIALTRYGYTLPLRTDLLTALSVTERRAYTRYSEAEKRTRARLNQDRDTLSALRSSIALIPPGNVYTRTSESSPLLIVAQNGLPLPVDATILYRGPDGAALNTPAQFRIPARGSLTLQMTADLPSDKERTDLQLFLSTPQNQPISKPVEIGVQTAGASISNWVVISLLGGLFLLALAAQVGKRRRGKSR